MALRTEAYYRSIAEEALARSASDQPPVPLEAIAALYGIPIRPVNLPTFFTAATVYEDGLPVFVVNWARPEEVRRRAIAHMLGHVLLVLHNTSDGFPREDRDHRDADAMSSELLLPARAVVDQARLWFNDYRYLSRMFGVPENEMLDRMRELGLMKGPEGVMWDY